MHTNLNMVGKVKSRLGKINFFVHLSARCGQTDNNKQKQSTNKQWSILIEEIPSRLNNRDQSDFFLLLVYTIEKALGCGEYKVKRFFQVSDNWQEIEITHIFLHCHYFHLYSRQNLITATWCERMLLFVGCRGDNEIVKHCSNVNSAGQMSGNIFA